MRLFVTRKWQSLRNYLVKLEIEYDNEIHKRDLLIHRYVMNSLKCNAKSRKVYEEKEKKCNEDRKYFKAKIEVVKEIRKYVEDMEK